MVGLVPRDCREGFGCNVSRQGTYWALATTTFFDKTSLYPLTRVSLALTNMTSDKIEDGVAKILNKGDVMKVVAKAKATEVAETETTLMECMEITFRFTFRTCWHGGWRLRWRLEGSPRPPSRCGYHGAT